MYSSVMVTWSCACFYSPLDNDMLQAVGGSSSGEPTLPEQSPLAARRAGRAQAEHHACQDSPGHCHLVSYQAPGFTLCSA